MADNVTLNTGSGGDTLAADDIGGVKYQRVKIGVGADGAATDVSDSNPMPIDDAGGSLTVDNSTLSVVGGGTEATALRVTLASDSTGVLSIDDNGGTITVDNAALSVTGGGVEASALRVTLASDSTGVLSVDDNGGSLTVDGTVTANLSATDNAVLDNIDTNTTGLAGCVSGTELQVDIVGSLPAGTNAIGKLAANSGVDIGDVDVLSQPARAATTDNIGAALMTNVIHNGTTALTPKYAAIDAATSGDNTIVSAVVGKKVRVLSVFLVAAGAVNVRFEDGASGTALTGQMNLTTNSGFTLPFNPVGWFETSANTLLNIELSGAVSVDGCLTYVEV